MLNRFSSCPIEHKITIVLDFVTTVRLHTCVCQGDNGLSVGIMVNITYLLIIFVQMGFVTKAVGSQLMRHYERILWPYDIFQAGATLDSPVVSALFVSLSLF